MHRPLCRLALLLLALSSLQAHAGRPLGTDDAATVGDKQCQLEAWYERTQDTRAWVASPACGLGEFELGLEASETKLPEAQKESAQSLALKWAPDVLKFGPVGFGAKLWTGRARVYPAAEEAWEGYRPVENGALLLASWEITNGLNLHANLGNARDRVEQQNARLANLALAWDAHERVMLFAEAQYQQRAGTTQATGLRLWAIPEKFGIDLTAARVAGVRDSTTFSIGFGWYGLFGN
ncbi:hypothetical protein [Uliginosibacterium sp. 31-12]|uniref:hypothetical protein n=1 Tax=Uliginosibacterium sp. 31-12 TaxID=3062781 RepID=UPI0026E3CA2C|nr:hypothetical protein [Uliginosibacterium sp. 31-12]MDO6386869.1 hypothetical protein [Uliginosibacterium sp. 31-12]